MKAHEPASNSQLWKFNKKVGLLEIDPKVVNHCLTTVGDDFKRQLANVDAAPRYSFPMLSEATRKEIHTLSSKTGSDLQLILQSTLAFMSMMISTGARPTEITRLNRDDLTWFQDPSRLLVRRSTVRMETKGEQQKIFMQLLYQTKTFQNAIWFIFPAIWRSLKTN